MIPMQPYVAVFCFGIALAALAGYAVQWAEIWMEHRRH